jgi:hypothetical protein
MIQFESQATVPTHKGKTMAFLSKKTSKQQSEKWHPKSTKN